MRTTIVPAQITTVEDKIAGNLNMTQIFLLLTPVFFGSIIYLIFPPQLHFSIYKLALMLLILAVCSALAIRIKGRVIIQWIAILLRYNKRPRYFIANKNDENLRDISYEVKNQTKEAQKVEKVLQKKRPKELTVTMPKLFKIEQFMNHPKAKLQFKFAKKGKLYVSVSEIK